MQEKNLTPSATIADLLRFAIELERIRQTYLAARDAIDEHRRAEEAARDRGDRRAVIEALDYVIGWSQEAFDHCAQFQVLAAEVDMTTTVAQRLAIIGAPLELESSFDPSEGIVCMLGAAIDSTPHELGGLYQLLAFVGDEGVRLSVQKARESRDWLKAELSAEQRGAILADCAEGWH